MVWLTVFAQGELLTILTKVILLRVLIWALKEWSLRNMLGYILIVKPISQ